MSASRCWIGPCLVMALVAAGFAGVAAWRLTVCGYLPRGKAYLRCG
jgi:hypothetical protein